MFSLMVCCSNTGIISIGTVVMAAIAPAAAAAMVTTSVHYCVVYYCVVETHPCFRAGPRHKFVVQSKMID